MTVLEDVCGWELENIPLMQRLLRPVTRLATLVDSTNLSAWQRRWAFKSVQDEVNQLWEEYGHSGKTQKLMWMNAQTGQTEFRDPFTALTYAYFAACWALLDIASPSESNTETISLPLRSCSPSTPPQAGSEPQRRPNSQSPPVKTPPSVRFISPSSSSPTWSSSSPVAEHHALILSVAWYLRLRDVGFSYLRLHSPLFVTAMYSASIEQRRVARMIFEEWESGSLKGIGALALERLDAEPA
ncbi:unnamed protein product [Periconia digitata]|uniref:Uncharacterized protein n=1 Tax=Periconia digitata TaxID=1303443 RepID=A0A9W4U6E4_9PLEO|nr:unnamed protein product [Periconia digitata]